MDGRTDGPYGMVIISSSILLAAALVVVVVIVVGMGATSGGRVSGPLPKFGRTPNFLHSFLMNRVRLCDRLHLTG